MKTPNNYLWVCGTGRKLQLYVTNPCHLKPLGEGLSAILSIAFIKWNQHTFDIPSGVKLIILPPIVTSCHECDTDLKVQSPMAKLTVYTGDKLKQGHPNHKKCMGCDRLLLLLHIHSQG